MATVITGVGGIAFAQLCARKGAVKLETLGMKRRGTPATEICRRAYGITARTRQGVLQHMELLVDAAKCSAIFGEFAQSLVSEVN